MLVCVVLWCVVMCWSMLFPVCDGVVWFGSIWVGLVWLVGWSVCAAVRPFVCVNVFVVVCVCVLRVWW